MITCYTIYSAGDIAFANKLISDLKKEGIQVLNYGDIPPSDLENNKTVLDRWQSVIIILSVACSRDEKAGQLISHARVLADNIILLRIDDYKTSALFPAFTTIDLKDYATGIKELISALKKTSSSPKSLSIQEADVDASVGDYVPLSKRVWLDIDEPSYPLSETAKTGTGFFTKLLHNLNPVNLIVKMMTSGIKEKEDSIFGGGPPNQPLNSLDKMMKTSAAPPARSSAPPYSQPAFIAPAPPAPAPPQPKPAKGKVLYDIPDNMIVRKQHRCVVRIGDNEEIVRDDDVFSDAVQIESISISGVMKVDLVDISEPPCFIIKTANSPEQEVETGSFTEWLFWVTPLTDGMFPLILKISIIRLVDGKERRKELVFEKSVTISAETTQKAPQGFLQLANTAAGAAPVTQLVFKNLLNEKKLIDTDSPVAFISYAHKDKVYFDIFIDYLQSQSGWTIWTDRNIEIGSDWYQRIQQSVSDADIAVLLISAHFISSSFIKEHEFDKFSHLQNDKPGFTFLPVFLRDVDFTRWQELAAMQLFVAYGDEYGVPEKKGQMIPFARLCRFDNHGQLIPNDHLDTYFKNLVQKAGKEWLKTKLKKAV